MEHRLVNHEGEEEGEEEGFLELEELLENTS